MEFLGFNHQTQSFILLTNEPQREKTNNVESDTYQAVQLQDMAGGLKFCI